MTNRLDTLFGFALIEVGTYRLTVGEVLLMLLVVLGALFLILGFRQLMKRLVFSRLEVAREKRRVVFNVYTYLILTGAMLIILQLAGVNVRGGLALLEEFFRYPLFRLGSEEEGFIIINVFKLLMVALIFLLIRIGLWFLHEFFHESTFAKRMKIDGGRRQAVFQIGKYALYLVGGLLVLGSLGIDMSVLAASSAAFFVVIGLGLQNTFNDFLSGIILLFEGTIEVGDIVEVGSLFGRVQEIRLRTSIVQTPDQVSIIVPNSKFTGDNVVNWSHNKQDRRFHVEVGVRYGSNVPLVRKVLRGVAFEHGRLLNKPEPKVWFKEFGDSALIFHLLFWVDRTFDIEEIKSDLRYKIDVEFRKHDIQIPFPQRDLHIKSDDRPFTVLRPDDFDAPGTSSPDGP